MDKRYEELKKEYKETIELYKRGLKSQADIEKIEKEMFRIEEMSGDY